jgi:uncharacterized protein (TIGR00297 family)
MAFSILTKKLSVAAALTGGILGFLVFLGAGFTGVFMMATFFLLGSFATGWKFSTKQAAGFAEKNKGMRTAAQVLANAGIPGLLGLLAWIYSAQQYPFILMMAAAFAAATGDTLSSELGMIYGKRFYNIISFRPDINGENGVVSLEGSLFGVAGSLVIALICCSTFGWGGLLPVVIGGIAGNLADSILGATFERKHQMNNNLVNFLNTLIAALVCAAIYYAI